MVRKILNKLTYIPREVYKRPAFMLFLCILTGMLFYRFWFVWAIMVLLLLTRKIPVSGRKNISKSIGAGNFNWKQLVHTVVLFPFILILAGSTVGLIMEKWYFKELPANTVSNIRFAVINEGHPTRDGRTRYEIVLYKASKQAIEYAFGKRFMLYTGQWKFDAGDEVELSACLIKDIRQATNGNKRYAEWLKSKKTVGIIYTTTRSRISSFTSAVTLQSEALKLRRELIEQVDEAQIAPSVKSLVKAVSLGVLNEEDSPELRKQFNDAGVAHLLAVSGFHLAVVVGFIACFFMLIAPWVTLHRLKWLSMIIGGWLFTMVTGFSAPTVRAALMLTVYGCGKMIGRKTDAINALGVAALLMLLWNPYEWKGIGFQLSFTAVLSIIIFMPRIERLIPSVKQPVLRYIWQSLAVCLSAQILLIPLCLYHFGSISLLFFWSNIPLVFVAVLLIPVALFWMLWEAVVGSAVCLGNLVEWLGILMQRIVELFAGLPMDKLNFSISIWVLILIWLLIFGSLAYWPIKSGVKD
ncbi:ComEC/Rec2 family competence protein [Porphyromonas macacae]|uniref:ComEC family competence protein n=1 Tax=Porphyromonas macacae TaxID=28115 RepID=A0A379DJC4_9PORP|nr:ComEC/Rec2 family competence protein [Porphyromonas macacae]SUB78480.1 ComEC family competence protein [Porphyromonas macacae]